LLALDLVPSFGQQLALLREREVGPNAKARRAFNYFALGLPPLIMKRDKLFSTSKKNITGAQTQTVSLGLQGGAVALLQANLRRLGCVIADPELEHSIFGQETLQAVLDFQKYHALEPSGVVDETTADALNEALGRTGDPARNERPQNAVSDLFIVRGQVWQENGTPLTGAKVLAFDKTLRQEKLLGQSSTDSSGFYEISYTPYQLAQPRRQSADVIVRVYTDNPQASAFTSKPVFSAPREVTVNFGHPRVWSEYERLSALLTPALNGVLLKDLTDDDVAYLSGNLGQHKGRLKKLADAARLADSSGLPAEILYGLARKGCETADLTQLFAMPFSAIVQALKQSTTDGTIPNFSPEQLQSTIERLRGLLVQRTLDSSGTGSAGSPLGAPMRRAHPAKPVPNENQLQKSGKRSAARRGLQSGEGGVGKCARHRGRWLLRCCDIRLPFKCKRQPTFATSLP
jgi:peptidoglycan hydrolase-like protein with peptidoglycan-binding domain